MQEAVKKGPTVVVAQKDRYSGAIGLVNCIRREPGCDEVRCVLIMDESAPKFSSESTFYQINLNLAMNVYCDGAWGTYRHLTLKPKLETKPRDTLCQLHIQRVGDLSSFTWKGGVLNKPVFDIVAVHYASINFRDVMMATGRLAIDTPSRLDTSVLGLEFSGIDSNGDRVMGLTNMGGFSTYVRSGGALTWKVPKQFTLKEAATIPVVYSTIYYAFFIGRKISKGQSILIHAGSGAVGLAAIRVAFAYGMEVFTTVSNPEKKKFIMDEYPQLKGKL